MSNLNEKNSNNTDSIVPIISTMETKTSAVTTTFNEGDRVLERDFSSRVSTDDYEIRDQSIIDFMAKPVALKTGSWVSTDATLSQLESFDIETELTSNSMWSNKFLGYNLVRGTAVIRVQINANPFQQGKLLLHFLPLVNQIESYSTEYEVMHIATLASMSQQPGIELDCRDTSAILKIPYVTPAQFYDIQRDSMGWGRFYLTVFAPLETGSGGELTVDYTVFLHFEDFEMAAPIVPQSDQPRKRFLKKTLSREQDALSSGPISQGLLKTSKYLESMAKIPILNSYLGTPAWVTRWLSNLASSMGYSKPINTSSMIMANTAQGNRYMANGDGADSSVPLALCADNSINISSDNSIYDADEMSVNFLKNVVSYYGQFSWDSSNNDGTVLTNELIGPLECLYSDTFTKLGKVVAYKSGHPISLLSNYCSHYRGSINILLKFVKTDFHSGRILITFTPLPTIGTVPDITTSSYSLREIVDIRTTNEVFLRLPYLLNKNFQEVSSAIGALTIIVLNPLRSPETCSDTISVLKYVQFGEDFELAGPDEGGPIVIVPHGDRLVDTTIGDLTIPRARIQASMESFGEKFESIKQILSRYKPWVFSTKIAVASYSYIINPWFIGVSWINGAGTLAGPDAGCDFYSVMSLLYAFRKGSARVGTPFSTGSTALMYTPNSTDTPQFQNSSAINVSAIQDWKVMANTIGRTTYGISNVNSFSTYTGGLAAYYNDYKCTINIPRVTNTTHFEDSQEKRWVMFMNSVNTSTANYQSLWRSFGDDFHFSYFIGTPIWSVTDPTVAP